MVNFFNSFSRTGKFTIPAEKAGFDRNEKRKIKKKQKLLYIFEREKGRNLKKMKKITIYYGIYGKNMVGLGRREK